MHTEVMKNKGVNNPFRVFECFPWLFFILRGGADRHDRHRDKGTLR